MLLYGWHHWVSSHSHKRYATPKIFEVWKKTSGYSVLPQRQILEKLCLKHGCMHASINQGTGKGCCPCDIIAISDQTLGRTKWLLSTLGKPWLCSRCLFANWQSAQSTPKECIWSLCSEIELLMDLSPQGMLRRNMETQCRKPFGLHYGGDNSSHWIV